MNKIKVISSLKKLLDSLKCPICKSPIDFIDCRTYNNNEYICVLNPDHYEVFINYDAGYPLLGREIVRIYDNNYKYILIKRYNVFDPTKTETEILIDKIDPEGRIEFKFKQKKIRFINKELFNFSDFEIEKSISRIKTILTFY